MRNFTLFAPTDKAIQQAFRSGALNYPYLFARNKTLLEGIVAYHAVPQFQFAGPSKQTINMRTLLSEVSRRCIHQPLAGCCCCCSQRVFHTPLKSGAANNTQQRSLFAPVKNNPGAGKSGEVILSL